MSDAISNWVKSGFVAMEDSMVIIYDAQFSEQDIDEMLAFYHTRVGKKITQNIDIISDLSIRAGENWAKNNKEALFEKMRPVIEKENEKYSYESLLNPEEVFEKLTPYVYGRPVESASLYKSTTFPFTVNYDSTQFKMIDCTLVNGLADVCFQSLDEQVFTIIIVEDLNAGLHELKAVALRNMYNATKEVEIKKIGLLNVNEQEVLNMVIDAHVNNIDFTYDNYYLTPIWGVMQIITFCDAAEYKNQASKMRAINNGIKLK